MAMETILTFAVVLALPVWLVGEEVASWFKDKRTPLKVVPSARDSRASAEATRTSRSTSGASHVA